MFCRTIFDHFIKKKLLKTEKALKLSRNFFIFLFNAAFIFLKQYAPLKALSNNSINSQKLLEKVKLNFIRKFDDKKLSSEFFGGDRMKVDLRKID